MKFLNKTNLSACLFALTISVGASALNSSNCGQGSYQGTGQGTLDLNSQMNKQECEPRRLVVPETMHRHSRQDLGGQILTEVEVFDTKNVIEERFIETVDNDTKGTIDTQSCQHRVQKQCCPSDK